MERRMIIFVLGIILGVLLSLFLFVIEAKSQPRIFERLSDIATNKKKGVIFDEKESMRVLKESNEDILMEQYDTTA